MRARIYQPSRTAMSSGSAKTHIWLLEFDQESARDVDGVDVVKRYADAGTASF
jgi:hypothetical protein